MGRVDALGLGQHMDDRTRFAMRPGTQNDSFVFKLQHFSGP